MRVSDLIPWNRRGREMQTRRGSRSSAGMLQSDITRAMDDLWGTLSLPLPSLWDTTGLELNVPQVDVRDTAKSVEVVAELPGMEAGDIEVNVAEGTLTIRGERKTEREEKDEGYVLRERGIGRFERLVPLPEGLDLDAAQAEFRNGVLRVTIPKTAEAQAQTRRIAVKRS